MEKIKFGKDETRNLLHMLSSPDEENAVIAFKAIENADLQNYIGELVVLFKFSKLRQEQWEKEAPKAWGILQNFFTDKSIMSSSRCLSVIRESNGSKEAVELFFEFFVVDMLGFLEQLGYPSDSIEINIKLKDEQAGHTK